MDQQNSSSTRVRCALLVGTDEVLLYTRQQILEKQGFRVSRIEPAEAIDGLESLSPDVIIACHTLTPEEAEALIEAARSIPMPPALIGFTRDLSPKPAKRPFDGTVWSLASPESFVSKVHELLGLRRQ